MVDAYEEITEQLYTEFLLPRVLAPFDEKLPSSIPVGQFSASSIKLRLVTPKLDPLGQEFIPVQVYLLFFSFGMK